MTARPTARDDDPDPIDQVAKLRELGATKVRLERTRGGTWRIEATWADQPAPRPALRAR